jgi:hypothetical protein
VNNKVRLLKAQADLIDAIDVRYDVSLINAQLIKISLPLQPSTWKQLAVEAAEALMSDGRLPEFLAELEEKQIRLVLERLGFVNGQSIGSGVMAVPLKGYVRAGSNIRVRIITEKSMVKGSDDRVFSYAVVTKNDYRETAKTAEELLDALGKCPSLNDTLAG